MLSKTLGIFHSTHCKGIHVNMLAASPTLYNPRHLLQLANAYLPYADQFPVFLTAQEISWMKDTKHFQDEESGISSALYCTDNFKNGHECRSLLNIIFSHI